MKNKNIKNQTHMKTQTTQERNLKALLKTMTESVLTACDKRLLKFIKMLKAV